MTRATAGRVGERVKPGIAVALAVAFFGAVLVGGGGSRHPGVSRRLQAVAPRSSPNPPPSDPFPTPVALQHIDLARQTAEMADAKSGNCISCHQGEHEPHGKPETVRLGCVDCHGGNPSARDKRSGARLSALSRRLVRIERQSGPLVHASEPRVA